MNDQKTNFLEVSVIEEILQLIKQIESKNEGKIGEDVVNERIKQVAYAKILCNVYSKDITYLIKAYAQLGIAYLDIQYFDQAQEHLLNAFKLNENLSDQDNDDMKEYQIKILINLSKCYLENNKLKPALQISEKSLKMNQIIFGENHPSNADIYYVIAKIHTQDKKYNDAIKYFKCMFDIYAKIHGEKSEKIAKVNMEIGQIYEKTESFNDAIEYYLKSKKIWEEIIKDDNCEVLFQISKKLSDLYMRTKRPKEAYEALKETDDNYSNLNRSIKECVIYQDCRIKATNYLNDIYLHLKELFILEEILLRTQEKQKTLAKTYIRISCIYEEMKKYDQCNEYLSKAEQIFRNNGDDKFANEMQQRKSEIRNKEKTEQQNLESKGEYDS